jgi:hypothetical protein
MQIILQPTFIEDGTDPVWFTAGCTVTCCANETSAGVVDGQPGGVEKAQHYPLVRARTPNQALEPTAKMPRVLAVGSPPALGIDPSSSNPVNPTSR